MDPLGGMNFDEGCMDFNDMLLFEDETLVDEHAGDNIDSVLGWAWPG